MGRIHELRWSSPTYDKVVFGKVSSQNRAWEWAMDSTKALKFATQQRHKLARWCVCLTLVLTGSLNANPITAWQQESDRFGNGQWEALGTEDGVALARKRIGGEGLFAVRGETVIKAPIEKVASVVYDESRWTEWSDKTSEAALLSQGPGSMKTVYQAVKMPFVLSDRDVVYTFGYQYTNGTLSFVARTLPYRRSPKTIGVRMRLVEGRWFLKPTAEGHTHLVLEILMDPKGSLPTWFVNLVQRDYPLDLLAALSKQARRSDVRRLDFRAQSTSGVQPLNKRSAVVR